jgi:hypothetical protein
MLANATRDHWQAIRLSAMVEAWARQQDDPTMTELNFDEQFGLLVDAGGHHRHQPGSGQPMASLICRCHHR